MSSDWLSDDDGLELTLVAVDKDRNSQFAVKWAVDNLVSDNNLFILVHVRINNNNVSDHANQAKYKSDVEVKQLFINYRGFCARKGVLLKEIILDDKDVSEALVSYIKKHCINNIVVGASTRNIFSRKFKTPDVPTILTKSTPDFCSLYIISKGKATAIRTAKRPLPPRQQQQQQEEAYSNFENAFNHRRPRGLNRGSWITESDKEKIARDISMKASPWGRPSRSSSASDTTSITSVNNHEVSEFTLGGSDNNQGSRVGKKKSSSSFGFQSCDVATDDDLSASTESLGKSPQSSELEAEINKLKLELDNLNISGLAFKEKISDKHQVNDFKEAMSMTQEAATHQVKNMACKASEIVYELEIQKKRDPKITPQFETDERNKILNALAMTDVRYRKYHIESIRAATEDFSDSLRIGEGGYGPVFRGYLDHTHVAIKILRPDAIHGMKQFQQEVQVLSSIKHPNMVMLLGACPEFGCLVYEYLDNGSLEDRLFRRGNTPTIPWKTRFKIAAEIATGLLSLHKTKPEPIVHRDLKPGNILLDHKYVSKISDVGLARLVPASVADSVTQYHLTSAAGTFCYIDPEYQQTGLLGTKSDIYSLGIMLLQIITARPAMGLAHLVEESIHHGTFADVLDPTVPDWPVEEALSYAQLALRCAELRKKDRPILATEILPELNRLRNIATSNSPSSNISVSSSSGLNSSSSNSQSVSSSVEITTVNSQ